MAVSPYALDRAESVSLLSPWGTCMACLRGALAWQVRRLTPLSPSRTIHRRIDPPGFTGEKDMANLNCDLASGRSRIKFRYAGIEYQ